MKCRGGLLSPPHLIRPGPAPTDGVTWAFLNKWLQKSLIQFLLTTKELWAIRLIAASVVVADIHKAIVADIRQAVVAGVDTDNILEEAAFAVE